MAILEAITGTRIYLDTNIFIYAVEGYAQFQAELNELFEAFDEGNLKALSSELTSSEVLVKPLIDNNAKVRSA
jgi:predicted nucleic acid-binding protein